LIREKSLLLKNRSVIENACAYIEEHYMKNIGAIDIAEYCGISVGYLSKLFNQHPYVSIPQYVTDTRLRHAVALLFEGRLTIGEIAARCGFSSANYFTKVFRAKYGESPRELRKSEGGV
jgi:AraC-like DNA-binding protein